MRFASAAALLLTLACSTAAPTPDSAPAATPQGRQIIVRDLDLLEATAAAVGLWERAVPGLQYHITFSQDCPPFGPLCVDAVDVVPPCGPEAATPGAAWACTGFDLTQVARDVPRERLVGTLAHELGHDLGLGHDAGGIMQPDRPMSRWEDIGAAADHLAQ